MRETIPLHVQIARDLFGWEYRDDWQAWCPPGWPPHEVINPPYLDKLYALERHGGQPRWKHTGLGGLCGCGADT